MLFKISFILIVVWMVHFSVHYVMLCTVDHVMRSRLLHDRLYFDVQPQNANGLPPPPASHPTPRPDRLFLQHAVLSACSEATRSLARLC